MSEEGRTRVNSLLGLAADIVCSSDMGTGSARSCCSRNAISSFFQLYLCICHVPSPSVTSAGVASSANPSAELRKRPTTRPGKPHQCDASGV